MDTEASDELMAVLMGEPSPASGPAAARHAAAAQDMRVLGEHLRMIGDRLAMEAGGETVPTPVRWTRGRKIASAAGVVLAACLAGIALQWQIAHPSADSDAKLTREGIVACSLVVAEGSVIRTEPAGENARVVLEVDRYLKPDDGPRETEFTVPKGESGMFDRGTAVVVAVSTFQGEPPLYFLGKERAEAWEWLTAAREGSRDLTCDGPG
ncbi:hypothetical protein ACIQM0_02680 [Streptomyces sp. NPDC091387]|uniref:hypothetical protein n=1 Tax=Streptomyces sp. NPDC091387 TaxID=3365998 RepID=UPI00382CF85B